MTAPAIHPFGISQDYYNIVCPVRTRRKVLAEDILSLLGREPSAGEVFEKTLEVIGAMPDKCIEMSKPSSLYSYLYVMYFLRDREI